MGLVRRSRKKVVKEPTPSPAVLGRRRPRARRANPMRAVQLTPVLRYLRGVGSDPPTAGPDDARLLGQFARHGDEAAFTALVRRHGPMVLGVCRRVLRDEHEAEDAFQATFLLLARKAGSLRRPERLAPWLYGVACRTALKARALAARLPALLGPGEDLPADVPPDDLLWRDLRPVLDEAIGWLPPKYRAPFVLCYLEGMTNAQAARHLGCPAGTVATRLSRARGQLRARLTGRGLTLSGAVLAAALSRAATSGAAPSGLVAATARAAAAVFAGAVAYAEAIPAKVAALTKGVSKAMLMDKVKVILAA